MFKGQSAGICANLRFFQMYAGNLLTYRHLINAFLVTSSFEFCIEEFSHDFICHFVINEASRHD